MRRLFQLTLVALSLTLAFAQSSEAQASVGIWAGPDQFHFGDVISVESWVADSPMDWCTEDWGCYWWSEAYVTAGGGGYGDTAYWDGTYAELFGTDTWPGQNYVATTYYASGGVQYYMWLCYEWGCDDSDWWEDGGEADASVSPAPLPGIMHLTMNAFIRFDNISDPNYVDPHYPGDIGYFYVFEGDGRDYFDENGSSRESEVLDVVNPYLYPDSPALLDGPYEFANLTQQYEQSSSLDASSHITSEARNDWTAEDHYLKNRWGLGVNSGAGCDSVQMFGPSIAMHCEMIGVNGVHPWFYEPAIHWDYNMTFAFGPTTDVAVTLTGCHKMFPAYEIYAAGQPIILDWDLGNAFDIVFPCSANAVYSNISVTRTIQLQ